jgi:1,5-anhydro-D-fructose reductase (1,5-anhydro-D-mannitol-forming)
VSSSDASTKKQVLIIGTGGIGKRHIRGFLKTDRARLMVVEPVVERLKDVLDTYPVERGYVDLSEVDMSKIDLAVICTPANVHIPIAQRCADSGLPFLLEKPLSTSMDGVDDLIKTVAEKHLVARVGYIRRCSYELIEMHKQVTGGKIGNLRMCYMNGSQEFPKYRPDYRETYFAREATGGGTILDGASHFFDVLIWFFGAPTEVVAMYDRLELTGVEVEDSCLISVRFANGGMAQINMNQFQKPNIATIEMIGTEANLMLDHTWLRYAADDSGQWESHDFMDG